MEKLFLRPSEAAEMIGFCRTSIYKLIRQEQIPYCKIGKSLRISVAALEEWAKSKGFEAPMVKPKCEPHHKLTKATTKQSASRKGVN